MFENYIFKQENWIQYYLLREYKKRNKIEYRTSSNIVVVIINKKNWVVDSFQKMSEQHKKWKENQIPHDLA